MQVLTEVIEFHKIPVTIFTTAAYALENKKQIKFLSEKHEIASHTFHHSDFKNQDLEKSKLILEEITGKEVYGLRMPRMRPIRMLLVKQAGLKYDSSINPTFIPGKYNNTHLPTTVYKEKEIYRFPCSGSPNLKIPLFWFTFKNSPYSLYKKLAADTLKKYTYLNLYFHPWEFADLTKYKLPFYIKRHSGSELLEKLHRLIIDLKKERFI
jgi:peptidoglycan/xylan/chitin deacetylase (PgdA/CDA1 family)